ncbi:hypothetical protein LN996_14150 [Arthrobacter sp. AK01]|uniref:hypothetical protein n=1 Tax=Micrococcaceae TaxID=1268 RepID=UPI001E37220C|nr:MULTISPECIES: hypothetical protein [Micrococcaceae]MCD4851958.1 hypothetical protein [Arthrobacter sp. AK01]MCP1412618.1 c-di-AMP phosphodiesterase-like protein [Paenarthrobacter sp. A20]
MELLDAHTAVITAVLLVHITGVMIVAASIAGLVISLFVVVLAVHAVRTMWELTQTWRGRGRFIGDVSKFLRSVNSAALATRPMIIAVRQRVSQRGFNRRAE